MFCPRRNPCSLSGPALCAAFLFLCLCPPVAAQFQFDIWTTDNGLPQNSVSAILQTRDGYLWVATTNGLVRFDGVRFTVFDHGKTPGIASNRCSALYEDAQGTLWIGTEEEWLTRYANGIFTSYSLADGQPHGEIRRIVADEQGALWLTTRDSLLRWQAGQAVRFPTHSFRLTKWSEDGKGNVWWRQARTGLHYLEQGQQRTITVQEGLPNVPVTWVYADPSNHHWLTLADQTLVKVKAGKLTVYAPKDGWPTGGVPFADLDGNLWTWGGGRLWTRAPDGTLQSFPGVPNKLETAIYVDREGSFWLGSGTEGLLHARRQVITAMRAPPNSTRSIQGLNSPLIYTIFRARSGAVWIGSGGGGPLRYQAGRYTHYFVEDGLFGTNVTAMAEDRAGTIWVGTTLGVSRYQNGHFTRFSNEHGLQEVWAIHEDRAGNLWFTTSRGLTKYKDGNFTSYTTREGLPDNRAGPILEARDGTLWFGTQNSLTHLADGRFTAYTEKDGLNVGQVRTLYEDSDRVLWIGTYESGLYRFQHGRFTRYTTNEGLYNNGVFQILEDARGNFWMSCNLGIYHVSKQELNAFADQQIPKITSVVYGKQDGMPSLECNGGRQPAGWKMRDGKLWFPTMGGIAIVDPDALPVNAVPPSVQLEELKMDNHAVALEAWQSALRPPNSALHIPPGQNHFELRFTGLSFLKPEQVRFKYRLAGWESDWLEAGTRRTAYYSYVAPGEYLFHVMAANSDGVWSEQAAVLRIVVLPHWYQTWWFNVGAWCSACLALTLLYRRHTRQTRRKQAAQEQVARQLIEAHESERKHLASELHDTLNQTLYLINNEALFGRQAPHESPAAQARFEAINDRAEQAIAEVHEIIENLRPFQLDHLGLQKALQSLLGKVEAAADLRLIVKLADLKGILTPDEETQIYRIVQEGLANILKHAQATEVRIQLVCAPQSLLLSIADNGCGFTPTTAPSAKPGGLGLTSLHERARILGGKLEIHSALGQGTTLTLRMPLTNRGSIV